MSKKIISFTLLSLSLLFSLTTLEAMRLKGLFRSPKAVLVKRLALPALVAAGASYALIKESYCEKRKEIPLMVTEDEEKAFKEMAQVQIKKMNAAAADDSSTELFAIKKSPIKLTEKEREEIKLDIMAFFSKHYVGPCPEQIRSIISHLRSFYTKPKTHEFANTFLLHGVPGTGKTYLAEELSHILDVPLLACNASLFIDKYSGESAKKICGFFKIIKETKTPLIIFIDEIDSIALKREHSSGGEYRSALTMLLTEIQDITFQKNIVLLVATNNLDSLDPAVTSRFNGQKIELKKIKDKKDFITFFERSLEKNGRTQSIKKEAEAIYKETQESSWGTTEYSLRQLKRIVPLALTHMSTEEDLSNKQIDFLVAIKEAIKKIKE